MSYLLIRRDCICGKPTVRICLKFFPIAWDCASDCHYAFPLFVLCIFLCWLFLCLFVPTLHLLLFDASFSLFPIVIFYLFIFFVVLFLSFHPYFSALPPCMASTFITSFFTLTFFSLFSLHLQNIIHLLFSKLFLPYFLPRPPALFPNS